MGTIWDKRRSGNIGEGDNVLIWSFIDNTMLSFKLFSICFDELDAICSVWYQLEIKEHYIHVYSS